MNEELQSRLEQFRDSHNIRKKGALSVVVHLTRVAKGAAFPLDESDYLAKSGGQVRGLSKASVQSVLRDYGVTRTLAQEAGRTSRGSVRLMKDYVLFLNDLYVRKLLDLDAIERWWVDRVRDYFASMPLKMKYDDSKSIQALFDDLFQQVRRREEDEPGATYLGTVLQHLVGAKIGISLPDVKLEHFGASVADHSTNRAGDFQIDRTVIHVTTMPSESLIDKCCDNLNANLAPVIITLSDRVSVAKANAEMKGVSDRIEVFAAEQFLATNLHELSAFQVAQREATLQELIKRYNSLIETYETNPGLKIQLG